MILGLGLVLLIAMSSLLGFWIGWHCGFRDRNQMTRHWETTARTAIESLQSVSSLRAFMDSQRGAAA